MDQRRYVLLFFSLFEHILGLGGQNFSEVSFSGSKNLTKFHKLSTPARNLYQEMVLDVL